MPVRRDTEDVSPAAGNQETPASSAAQSGPGLWSFPLLHVYLGSVARNLRLIAERIAPLARSEIAAVIKADAYGLGAEAVAPVLYDEGVRLFFVSTAEEAQSLLGLFKGFDGAVLSVLNGCMPGEEAFFSEHGLVPVLNTMAQIRRWNAWGQNLGRRQKAILHIDTGMRRLGLEDDAEPLRTLNTPAMSACIDWVYLMSHLACSGDLSEPMNRLQCEQLESLRRFLPGVPVMLANSGGVFLGPEFHFQAVRVGAALYGLRPNMDAPNPLYPCIRLESRILQIRQIDEGSSVGYSATWRAARPSRIACVLAGYRHGYLRSASNRSQAIVRGQRAKAIGTVSMDLLLFDITDIPDAEEGDAVELLGPVYDADALGDDAGTIGYEILTSLGNGCRRRYCQTALERGKPAENLPAESLPAENLSLGS